MIQGLRNKISYIPRATKRRLSLIVVGLILSCLIYIIIFNGRIIEPQNVLSVLGTIYTNSFNDLDSENVVSILGTLAQSNATILAIVVSLSLVVIEFSASKYSARVVDVFKRDPILWGFLIVYGFSIFCPIFLTSSINENTSNSSLKFYFITTYVLSIIAYFSLFLYILYVFKMMKPSSVIGALSKKIDIQSLHESWYPLDETYDRYSKEEPRINKIDIDLDRDVKSEKDPILPIIDIIRASIMRYEYDTARYGLKSVKSRLLITLIQNPFEEKRVSGHVFKRILEIWNLALRNKDLAFIKMVLTQYIDIGKLCAKEPNFLYTTFLSEYYIKQAFKSISEVKEDEFQSLSIDLVNCVNEIGLETFRNRYEFRLDDNKIKVLESLESSVTELSYFLRDIGVIAIKEDSKRAVEIVILALDNIAKASVDHNLIHSIFHIVENLNIIGEESVKKGMDFVSSTKQVVECLEKLASRINAHSEEFTSETQKQVIEYHEYVKENYDYENTKYAFEELIDGVELIIRAYISSHVYTIGRESIRNNLLDAAQKCLKSLETIERILRDDTESRHIGEDIRCLGLEAIKKEQTYPLMKNIINSIYLIGLRQFGYMFDWERDRDSWDIDPNKYQKFLKKEYSDYSARGLQSSYSDFVNSVGFEDTEDFYYGTYPDDIIYGERKLIIDKKERKDIKCLNLKDIDDRYPTLKLFKNGVFKNSEKAYYKVPELLWELTDPVLKYTQNSPCDKTRKPLDMVIQCFENFGIISVHFRDNFSLKEISKHLTSIGYSFYNLSNSENNKSQDAWDNLDCATTVVSRSIYKLAIGSLRHKFVDSSILYQQMDCLIRIQKEYHNSSFDAEYKFEGILKMIKESELKESEREKIVKLLENAIQEFENKEK